MIKKNQFKSFLYRLLASLVITITIVISISNNLGSSGFSLNGTTVGSATNTLGWQSVPIGGGAYVTGIYAHPRVADLVYMQTDNGGAYRWDPQQEKWQNIIDDFPHLPWNYYGVESMALDPQNPDLVYMALGKYTDSGKGRLWKSSDRGQTWLESDLEVPMGADEDKRWAGNRLAVSPHNGNLLLFGSRRSGLWRSLDAGLHWSRIKSLKASPRADIGLINVAFDPQAAERIYLSAYGDGIYQSDDAGSTWTKMLGSPVHGMKMNVSGDRTVYVTSDISPGVSKYANGAWQEITPPGYQDQVFNALSVDPHNPKRILVALGEVGDTKIFYSVNGGNTWSKKSTKPQVDPAIPWLTDRFFNDHTSAVIFDPTWNQRVWLSDWFGVWRTDNFKQRQTNWANYPKGQEQIVTFSLVAPPKGAMLLSGVADVEGFYHRSLDTYPQDRFGYGFSKRLRNQYWQDTYSIDYCAKQPLNLVRVGGKRDSVLNAGATSTDGGLTWHKFANFPNDKIPLRVAVSATNPEQFIVVRSEGQSLQTKDNGNSWQQVSGLPDGIAGPWNWTQSLTADQINGSRFYYYAGGTLYRSEDGGITFMGVNHSLPSVENHIIKTAPGIAGEVWLSLDGYGLYISRDSGVNFTQVSQVKQSKLLTFGKASATNHLPWLYLYGKVTNQEEGLFRSSDRGETWHKLNDISLFNNDQAKTIRVLEASKQKSDLVFIGTDGRGIYYRYIQDNNVN